MRPVLLSSHVQPYAWGSLSALAALRGEPPTGDPEAELWIGAHPSAPSSAGGVNLNLLIAEHPIEMLGHASVQRFGDELPFLLKVLAADAPLSLQAHPTRAQAEDGFDAEEARGVPLTSPSRVFKDRNHKPELLCALTEFEALCGFRPVDATAALLESLDTPFTRGIAARLRNDSAVIALRSIVVDLLSFTRATATALLDEVLAACGSATGLYQHERDLALRLANAYPGDVGAIVSLLMNRVELHPGQALVLDAGNLHAYVQGVGVELMANSDNVLRCGLTPKHVDIPGLLQVLDWHPLAHPVHEPITIDDRQVYPSPSDEFSLERIELPEGAEVVLDVSGPELLWCQLGHPSLATDEQLPLYPSASVFVPAVTGRYRLRGPGTVFRSTIGPLSDVS